MMRVIPVLLTMLVGGFLLLPVAALAMHMGGAGPGAYFAPDVRTFLFTSLEATVYSMAVILSLGTVAGFMLARRRGAPWRALEFLLMIPLLLPPLVIGLLLMYVYGPYGLVGQWLAHFRLSATNTLLAVVIAQIYEAMPYYLFAAQGAFSQVDESLERTSQSLGRPPLQTFFRITLPLAAPGLTAGFAMAFARSIGAFGAVIVVAYYPHTLPVAAWIALEEQGLPSALLLAVIFLLAALPFPLILLLWRRLRHAGSLL